MKVIFYIVFFHNRLHFTIFNGFLHTGVLISCRTVIHTKFGGQGFLGLFDYFFALLCLTLVLFDFRELIGSCYINVLSLRQGNDYQTIKSKMDFYKEEFQNFTQSNIKDVDTIATQKATAKYNIRRINSLQSELTVHPLKLDFKPYMIPISWLTPKEAKILGYKRQINKDIVA